MTPEKQAKIKALRDRLKNLSDTEKQALINRGMITNIDGHVLSVHNTILLYLQSNGTIPSVIGGFNQWRNVGKSVKKGEHGFIIFFPVGEKSEDGDIINATNFYTATVFDITQVQDLNSQDKPEPVTPEPIKPEPEPVRPTNNDPDYMQGFTLIK